MPTWPPQTGFYQALYDGNPCTYPGITPSFSFSLIAPAKDGVYYLYFCGTEFYTMQQIVSTYTTPLALPYSIITGGALP
jgi:hypothetical protein